MFNRSQLTELADCPVSRKRSGAEGVVSMQQSLCLKIQSRCALRNEVLPVEFRERSRRAVHGVFNALVGKSPLTIGDTPRRWYGRPRQAELDFLHVDFATSSDGYAVGVFRRIQGKVLTSPRRSVYEAARNVGAVIDIRGIGNVVRNDEGIRDRYTVLETLHGVHLESFLQLQALREISPERYRKGLYFLSWALALGQVYPHPTLPFACAADQSCVPYPDSQAQFWAWVSSGMEAGRLSQLEAHELQRARVFFGRQYTPQPLNLETFSNYSNFGLSQEFIGELYNLKVIIAEAASRVLGP